MLSDEIRTRLGQLHRPLLLAAPSSEVATWAVPRRETQLSLLDEPTCAVLDQGVEIESAWGKFLRFRRDLTAFWPQATLVAQRATGAGLALAVDMHAELAAVLEHFPQGTLFLDLETCGFAGSMVFLAGVVWQCEGTLVLDQLFARNYAEEKSLLTSLWQIAADNRVLITFNGKSFDWPMVHDRSTRHHLGQDQRGGTIMERTIAERTARREFLRKADPRPELVHCDLLHHARRRWKGALPNCKLQTLERYICNRARRDDLSGAQVPVAYHQFVRTGSAHQVGSILHHNALDLVTLVQITLRLLHAPAARAETLAG